MALKIGIIGARGIGYTHARHYNELGADIAAVLCSSELSTKTVADNLKKSMIKKFLTIIILMIFLVKILMQLVFVLLLKNILTILVHVLKKTYQYFVKSHFFGINHLLYRKLIIK